MPTKIWAIGEEVLAADFNDYVQEQVVATFPNAAARTAAIAAPTAGMLTFRADAAVYEWWTGSAWRALQGVLAYVETATPQSGITAVTDLAGLALPAITVPGGHRVELSAEVGFTKAGADTATWVALHITDGANSDQVVRFGSCPAPGWVTLTATRVLTLGAGTYSFKARAETGAGFVNTQTGPTAPVWIMARDLGAA